MLKLGFNFLVVVLLVRWLFSLVGGGGSLLSKLAQADLATGIGPRRGDGLSRSEVAGPALARAGL